MKATLELHVADAVRQFHHRGTAADRAVIDQHLRDRAHDFSRLRRGAELQALYDDAVAGGRRPLILDAGANIGASAIHFAHAFPAARVIAIEPAAANFALLARNVAGLDVEAIRAAIGPEDGEAALVDPGLGDDAFRVVADGSGERVPVRGAARLIREAIAAGFVPFIAKIDIEGGEAALFAGDVGWVDAFPLLIVELHDWLLCGSGASHSFLRCVAMRDRDFIPLGECVYSIRNPPRQAGSSSLSQ